MFIVRGYEIIFVKINHYSKIMLNIFIFLYTCFFVFFTFDYILSYLSPLHNQILYNFSFFFKNFMRILQYFILTMKFICQCKNHEILLFMIFMYNIYYAGQFIYIFILFKIKIQKNKTVSRLL